MTRKSDLYRDCFWCGKVYDFWRHEACPGCGSRLEQDGFLGPLAGEHNKRPDYDGPDFTAWLEQRQAMSDELRKRFEDSGVDSNEDHIRRYLNG